MINLPNITPKLLLTGAGIAAVYFYMIKREATKAIDNVTESVSEVVDAVDTKLVTVGENIKDNPANSFFESVYKTVTDSEQNLGEDIYDILH